MCKLAMDAEEVLDNWSDIDSDEESCGESSESSASSEEEESDKEETQSDSWEEVIGLYL